MNLEIVREDGPERGRYVARLDDRNAEAELTYVRVSPTLLIADHTGVPPAFRGRGYAQALVARLAGDARREGFHVIARCPFVRAELSRRPEWVDIVAPG